MDKRLEKLLNENFEEFLKEISQEDLLTREEERVLIKAVQEKGLDSEEADRLVKANLRFVVSLVGQYRNRGLTLAELITIGAEELRKSILSYDLNSGTKLCANRAPSSSLEMAEAQPKVSKFITHFVALMRVRLEKEICQANEGKKEI